MARELGDDVDPVLATIQHALARGIESVFQLEEGEILVEPTPSRKERKALFFYEAAEGGAGALSRLIFDDDALRRIGREALEITHVLPASIDEGIKDGLAALRFDESARCVAGCYRCLLSYFNQPDHELIDRQHPAALAFLLRMASAQNNRVVTTSSSRSLFEGCPPHDDEPLVVDGVSIPWVWRKARVAAIEEPPSHDGVLEKLRAKGVQVFELPEQEGARLDVLSQLRATLAEAMG